MGTEKFFREEMIAQGRGIAALGATDEEIADILGIGVRTLYRWKTEIPPFAEALEAGKHVADNAVERSVYQRARCGDLKAARWWLQARRPDIFRFKAVRGQPSLSAAEIQALFPAHQSNTEQPQ